jgi:modification methylase
MSSFVGDTVLDPFLGTGTTTLAALQTARNSLGYEIDPEYLDYAERRVKEATADFFSTAKVAFRGGALAETVARTIV